MVALLTLYRLYPGVAQLSPRLGFRLCEGSRCYTPIARLLLSMSDAKRREIGLDD